MEPDVTEALVQGTTVVDEHISGANSGFMSVDDTTDGAPTGQTLSSEESGSDGEVQSTPEGFAPRKPYLGMKFDTSEAAKVHYNRYAEHVGFSMKMSSSKIQYWTSRRASTCLCAISLEQIQRRKKLRQ